ncbi:galactose-binding domain-containing protein [Streptomyces fuscigenes]|uniref:galactose-binding domain-containing protein n=1 Tax=Streptomyces fuscigenes TaxID=1528880 RepID=UPI001F3A0DF9|nr:discoidin domain-containing protein [Streptomyces fuscigenes]MCF3962372.1 discoidin domain-containing protein [Streptomyces fuscigenes]
MRSLRRRRRTLAVVTTTSLLMVGWPSLAAAAGGPPSAAGAAAARAAAAKATDGDQSTYWQGTGKGEQSVQRDLGAVKRVDKVTLKLPRDWKARKQTLSLQGSQNGTGFETLKTSATYTFSPGAGNTVTIAFPATRERYIRAVITGNSVGHKAQLSELEVHTAAAAATPNLALGKTMTASGFNDVYPAPNANDGNQSTYWESKNNAFPQWIQADLGSSVAVNSVVLKLPSGWEARNQTLTIQGSTNGSSFSDIAASKSYAFSPTSGNTVTITFNATTTRYVRASFTANTAWPAGQVSEFEIYGPATGDTQAPSAPSGLALTQPATGQIRLGWQASTDDVGVTGYDIYRNNQLVSSVAGNVTTYTESQPTSATVTYFVRARDAAGNVSGNSNSVTRTGDTGDTQAPTAPGGLAYTEPASGQVKLTWTASSDNTGVTGYDIYRDDKVVGSVAGNVTTYTDTGAGSGTVTYYVRAKDAAGNTSGNSNSVTRNGSSGTASNLAVGKPISASSSTFTFVATNANDNSTSTYWEGAGGSYPNTLTVQLGANADTQSVVVKLNPDSSWGARTQNIQVLGREQNASGLTSLVAAKDYSFDPASGNTVTIPVSARVADVQLKFNSNTGAPAGQVAEFQVLGTPAPNPDLQVTSVSASPASPVESDAITLSATVKNAGALSAAASTVQFNLGGSKVGAASVGALAAGAQTTVSADIGAKDAGTYQLSAVADPDNKVVESNETNNTFTAASSLVVKPVASSDLVATSVATSPSAPSAGDTVTFSVAVKNQGTVAAASGSHGVTLTLLNASGGTVKTLTGSFSGALAAGATSSPVNLGTWTAADGSYTEKVVVANDANELPVKQANNTSTQSFFVGRGADMPYDTYEAEDGVLGGGAQVVGPNRTIGDLAGEASGRKAVTLNNTGNYVEFTTRAATNSLVTRFSIPDSAGGGGTDASLDIYVNGKLLKPIDLNSKYAWLYGAETGPGNSPGSGAPRHVYDEANVLLGTTVPAGSTIRLQKDAANTSKYAIDFVDLEQAAQVANPDPATYVTPAGFGQQDVQNALDKVRMDTTGKLVGVYLPAGDYQTSSKFQVYGKPVKVVGAGPWFTRFDAPSTQENTDVGFRVETSANGSSFTGFAAFGNYTSRIDGPGKEFDLTDVSNITVDDVWIEHMVCAIWGTHVSGLKATDMRIRDTFADGINLTNGSQNNLVSNDEARTTGDDSFALFAAEDHNSSALTGNTFQNLTAKLPWRAAGLAVYGGQGNTLQNITVSDTLTYAGLTLSSLDFGYPFPGFGSSPQTVVKGLSLIRDGGHFWGSQVFGAVWVFSATDPFQGIRVSDLDITDPTYGGIMFQTDYVGGQALNPIKDTVFTDVSISGAHKSGDQFDAKSGWALWANELPEAGQGPAVGEVTFNGLKLSDNVQDVRNTTSTMKITINP